MHRTFIKISTVILSILILIYLLSYVYIIPLFRDKYKNMPLGPIGLKNLDAFLEYHYIANALNSKDWEISTFHYSLPPSWYIVKNKRNKYIYQNKYNNLKHWHPIIITGTNIWNNYKTITSFILTDYKGRNGIVFRYQNDRCYYFAGSNNGYFSIIKINHEKAFRDPDEKIMFIDTTILPINKEIKIKLKAHKQKFICWYLGKKVIIKDSTFKKGKIGFLSDSPAYYGEIKINTNIKSYISAFIEKYKYEKEEYKLSSENPKMVLWKKINTKGFGTGRNLRFGDLDNDGQIDILIGQVVHHGPKDRNSEISCITAINLDGKILWQIGEPDPWKYYLTNDVAFQIHDIDNDGKNEVLYCKDFYLIIAEGKSGKTIKKTKTPEVPKSEYNKFGRVLGDCLFFCDIEGKGYPMNIILKDRYNNFWVYNNNLEILWQGLCKTGHYPYAKDIDNDGKDEILMGYTLFDDNGKILWSNDSILNDHSDGGAIVKLNNNEEFKIVIAASDEGFIIKNLEGKIIIHSRVGHVQNPAIANFRNDHEGLEIATINYWGNQGIINIFDSKGKLIKSFEPFPYGGICIPINWNGRNEQLLLVNCSAQYGYIYDGYGHKVISFPHDGHPEMCYFATDITGDCRDEILVWDPEEIWIYTQSDNPRKVENCYNKNPLYNTSNYQAITTTHSNAN